VLVTGGAGFIGSNLIDSLLAQDNEVVCLDNFFTGKRENVAHHQGNPKFTLIEGDIRDLATCRRACDGIGYVLHQAALGSVPRSIDDPILSTEVNVMGFLNMLVAARDARVKRFVYAASSSTYGDSTALPKVEENIGKPLSPYAITKYVDELYAGNFSELYGMETVGLRYFNVYGARQDPFGAYAAVIPSFVSALLKHERPVINGDGTFSRDFTYVDNIVQINQLAAIAGKPEAVNTVYNAACGERTDLTQLIGALKQHLSEFDPAILSIEPVYGPSRRGDIPHSLASIDKAVTLLGYAPRFNFSQGIAAAAKWYYENLRAN
ncbi:MAG: SDR family oxidoreductase, partial [Verrucomicrobiaceae bacterium]